MKKYLKKYLKWETTFYLFYWMPHLWTPTVQTLLWYALIVIVYNASQDKKLLWKSTLKST